MLHFRHGLGTVHGQNHEGAEQPESGTVDFHLSSFLSDTQLYIEALRARGLVVVEDEAVYAAPLYRAEVDAARRLLALSGPRTPPSGSERAIADAVRSRAAEAEALSYVHSLGLGPAIAKRIRKQYGDDTVRVLRDDPYLVAEQVSGVGFRTADSIGRALGYGIDDPRRAAGARSSSARGRPP